MAIKWPRDIVTDSKISMYVPPGNGTGEALFPLEVRIPWIHITIEAAQVSGE